MGKYSSKKINFIYIQSSKEVWAQELQKLYIKKISPYVNFKVVPLKSVNSERHESARKVESESSQILKKLEPTSLTWIFDEQGENLTSEAFASELEKVFLDSSKRELNLVVGGAFGLSQTIKNQAHKKISLSSFVLNHHVAQAVVLEQLYRSFKIIHSESYHNGAV